jgi:hypothetical protein
MASVCHRCNEAAAGYCLLHVPDRKVESRTVLPAEERAENLYKAMESLLRHEGRFMVPAPRPHGVAVCNYCGLEARAHDADCAWIKAAREWKRNAP